MSTKANDVKEVQLKRPVGYYQTDNELVDHLAAEIGIFAFGVYHMMLRLAMGKPGVRVSQRQIAETLGISTDSARNAIATLKQARLIEEQASVNPNDPSMYLIVFAKDLMAARGANPPVAGAKFRTRVKTKRVRNSGHVECEIQDGRVRNSAPQSAKFRTPNKEEDKNENKGKTTPLPPASGGILRDAAREGEKLAVERFVPRGTLGALLSAEEQAELDEVNAMRARRGSAPLSVEAWMASRTLPVANPVDPVPTVRRKRRRTWR